AARAAYDYYDTNSAGEVTPAPQRGLACPIKPPSGAGEGRDVREQRDRCGVPLELPVLQVVLAAGARVRAVRVRAGSHPQTAHFRNAVAGASGTSRNEAAAALRCTW